ncbi:MAG: TerC/Alx family metal homeostasis membrane protein [Bacteroidota bacterium]
MGENAPLPFLLFGGFILLLLGFDLGVLQRRARHMRMREAAAWSVGWVTLALLFNLLLYYLYEEGILGPGGGGGGEAALQFLTGYLIELALSVDNLFVFLVLFSYFGVPERFQHKVLFWGILGAILMRLVFIVSGAMLVSRFEWILMVFGVILVFSGWKMLTHKEMEVHPDRNLFIRLARRLFPVTSDFDTPRFMVRRQGRLHLTPMLLVLITVETTDVVFAVDSIPAIFAVTRDPFIIFTSNIFAVLGLRSLYFVLSGAMAGFHYLKTGLSAILIFIGLKMLAADLVHVPVIVSLTVVVSVLSGSVIASLIRRRRARRP